MKSKSDKNLQSSEEAHRRINYEDHSLKFLDWVDRLGIEKTVIGRLFVALDDRVQLRKMAFVFGFSLVLAGTITFEFKTPMDYQVGDIAKTDVVAPLSFEMVDEVTTEEKRLRAEMAVPVIFDYDPGVFDRVSTQVYRAFRLMRFRLKNTVWPKSLSEQEEKQKELFVHKADFERELGVPVSEYLFEWLIENRFSARLENALIRNLDLWYQNKITENPEKSIPSQSPVILARSLQKNSKGREFSLRKVDVVDSGRLESFVLKDFKGLDKLKSHDLSNLQAFARLLIYPNLTLNKLEVTNRKQMARQAVLPITLSIKKSQTIIKEGAVVQPFHMALLREIQALKSDRRHDMMSIAMAMAFFALILIFFQYLRRFSLGKVKVENKDIIVMGLVALIQVVAVKLFLFTMEAAFMSKFGSGWISASTVLFAAPIAMGPMLVGLVIQSGEVVWLFTAFTAIAMGMMTEMNFPYMLITLAGGIAAARGVFSCKKRNDIYWAGMRAGLVNSLMIALMVSITQMDQENFVREVFVGSLAGFAGGILSSLASMMLIPLLESLFNYTTDIKLLELSNLNHPLLREMIVKAPGTYHHSMLVGSMVEAAAEEIGANSLLGKVMCYYHDIGKIEHANYFIENQKPGNNPHDHISPYLSKTLLVAHVKDGVELGIHYKLGKPIIDGIVQHHGTTLISYFYNKAIDIRQEGDAEVPEEEFRYPGPKPQFREAALCMLADSIEAAARSLDEPTPVRLQNIVRNIIQRKFMEGQLDECNLTLRDLSKVELAFTRILLGIYHQRIDYPRSAGGGAGEASTRNLFPVSGTGGTKS
jgi:hypothetical protein